MLKTESNTDAANSAFLDVLGRAFDPTILLQNILRLMPFRTVIIGKVYKEQTQRSL